MAEPLLNNAARAPETPSDVFATWSLRDRRTVLMFAAVLFAYIGLRLVGWLHADLVEGHDSINYLQQIEAVIRDGIGAIRDYGPDAAPLFPALGALFGAMTGATAEMAARGSSLFVSVILFFALVGIGRRMSTPVSVAAGLLFVACNTTLILLSYSVLTEPSYIAAFYVALWIFWMQFDDPNLRTGALLGIAAGVAFLGRLEGVLLLAFFPALQALHYFFFSGHRAYDGKRLAGWTAVFAVTFCLLALPQVWSVSDQMGRLALNGRQAWVALLNSGDRDYQAAIYGLDYDPAQVNLAYVQAHPEALDDVASEVAPRTMLRRIVLNFDTLYRSQFGELLGVAIMALFALGLLDLWLRGRRFEAFVVVGVIGVGIAAPLAHNVIARHIAVIFPIVLLTAGLGAGYLARNLLGSGAVDAGRRLGILTGVITLVALAGWAYPLSVTVRGLDRPTLQDEPDEFGEPATIVRSIAEKELGRPPVIVSRYSFFPYYVGAGDERLHLPYTDYDGLVEYSSLNDADFLYLVDRLPERARPFMNAFTGDSPPPGFELLYSAQGRFGRRVSLYRFLDGGGGTQ